ncbi:sensor domain-containing protein [Alicyclobacillus mengziensis]|uniref:Sensor domain-containing diguanylate cyclase n=1 Tax=Alicyclobacillus mengziensis TaxID=2931921 RepID=A0A9X7VZF6_9BACL|nr:sensor domain-containing diguanylate cyclase [Alicyclobacillus mengziensis]QSO47430.1 sensor domain-containing diguanylate cyclase [Alicyclobacillus mengziensis]
MITPTGNVYNHLEQASAQVLQLLSEFIGVNTLYIAVNDKATNFVLSTFNRHQNLVQTGDTFPLLETYCGLVTRDEQRVVVIDSTATSLETSNLDVTRRLGDKSFIGVPIVLQDRTVCGTICALDSYGYQYSERDIALLKSMATFLGYVVDLEHLAFRDTLTDSFSRNFLRMYLSGDWKRRFETVALLFIDVDNFKEINDTYGHAAGDEVLCEVVKRLRACVRKSDIVCRFGGDEFVVIIPNYGQIETLEIIAADILSQFESSALTTAEGEVRASVSIGVSTFPQDGTDVDVLLQQADEAMYYVKQQHGKNNYQIYSSGHFVE